MHHKKAEKFEEEKASIYLCPFVKETPLFQYLCDSWSVFVFLTTSKSISSTFELEIVLICCRKLTETTTFSLFRGFNILVHKVYR